MSYVNKGGGQYGDVNCALCTVAAIFNTDTIEISKMLGMKGHQPDGALGMAHRLNHKITNPDRTDPAFKPGDELQQDFNGMKEFVTKLKAHLKDPVYVSQGGSYDTPVPLEIQTRLMTSYPAGTQFAIWGCQSMVGYGAHWNYAVRTAEGVEYRDYQYNNAENHPPQVSPKFIPPKGNEDEADQYVVGVVLTFRGVTLKMPYEK